LEVIPASPALTKSSRRAVYGAASRAPSPMSASCAAWNACRPAGVPQ